VLNDRDDSVELVLVDNGSTDATLDVMQAATAGEDRVRIVLEPRRGVNRARNAGIAATDAPLVLLCDADDEIEPGWIDELVKHLAFADLVGGALRPVNHHGELTGEAALPDTRTCFDWGLPNPWGANCGVRRAAWARIGGFEADISGGGDEEEFFVRAQIDGATFTWAESAIVRYTQRDDPQAHGRLRWRESWRNLNRVYWIGRLRGWPRDGQVIEDVVKCSLLLPLAPFSSHWRWVLRWRATRRWQRLRGLRCVPRELGRRVASRPDPPSRFPATLRFRRDWRRIRDVGGALTRAEALVLHTLAAQMPPGRAIVEIGSWEGRSTTALALGCRRDRPVHAVDPHTGGMSLVEKNLPVDSLTHFRRNMARWRLDNVVEVVERSVDAAAHYDGPPVGLLFIDGWHSTEAVLEDFGSWAPHLAPGATVVFHDRRLPEVRAAISRLRPALPRRLLEISDLAVFVDP
ncbi:MAG: glycosyltransferase, partial [Acidimicrobiia bacterium]|nr:glycosyltransferase [Acidimicrobiia bacterium]